MKKKIILLLLLSLSISLIGQTIPNGSFENWNIITYETPNNYPITSNPDALRNGDAGPNVVKSSDVANVQHGTYAAMLSSTTHSMGFFINSAWQRIVS